MFKKKINRMFCFNYNCGKDVNVVIRKIDVGFSLNTGRRKNEPKIIYLQLKLNITQQESKIFTQK